MNDNFVTQQLCVHVMSTLNFEFVEKWLEVFFLLVCFPVWSCRYYKTIRVAHGLVTAFHLWESVLRSQVIEILGHF